MMMTMLGSISHWGLGSTEHSILDQGQFNFKDRVLKKEGEGGGAGDGGKWDTGIRLGPGQDSAFVFGRPPIHFAFVL